jgi:4'-phosphopantetheinyl transferase
MLFIHRKLTVCVTNQALTNQANQMESGSTSSEPAVRASAHPTLSWDPPPSNIVAATDEVHVWRVALNESHAAELRPLLSSDECARADRFHFARDCHRFIVARGMLRKILGAYLKKEPGHLSFSYSPYGKPALADERDAGELSFNLSHANELALIAVTRGRGVGVDIEFIRPEFASEEIAERFFSTHEVAALRALPKSIQSEAFFNCWTRKEAYIKAIGEGMSMPLDQFQVSLAPGSRAELLGNLRDANEVSRWSLQELAPGPGYAAAIAVEGKDWQLRCWQHPDGSQLNL